MATWLHEATSWVGGTRRFSDRTERIVEAGLIRRVDRVRTALTFFVLALVFVAPEGLLTNPGVTYCSVALAALLAIWTLFFLDWEGMWAKGRLPLLGTILMLADVAWLSLLIYGTGGFYSPFESSCCWPSCSAQCSWAICLLLSWQLQPPSLWYMSASRSRQCRGYRSCGNFRDVLSASLHWLGWHMGYP